MRLSFRRKRNTSRYEAAEKYLLFQYKKIRKRSEKH
jgi:hypothetical protein